MSRKPVRREEVLLKYGKDTVALSVPGGSASDQEAEVLRALANPIGAPTLSELARGKKTAAVMVPDITPGWFPRSTCSSYRRWARRLPSRHFSGTRRAWRRPCLGHLRSTARTRASLSCRPATSRCRYCSRRLLAAGLIPADRILLGDPTHVCVVVRDVEKTARLYSSLFGIGPFRRRGAVHHQRAPARRLHPCHQEGCPDAQVGAHGLLATYYHNFVRHMLEAELQRRIYKLAEAGQPVTATVLSKAQGEILEGFWGGLVEVDERARLTWMRQPHFYMGS